MRKSWTVLEQRTVLKMFETMTAEQISKETGRSKSSLYGMKYRINPTPKNIRRKGELEQLVREYYAQGMSDTDMGRILGLCSMNIYRTRKRLGLPVNRKKMCVNGHDIIEVGRFKNGACKKCNKTYPWFKQV